MGNERTLHRNRWADQRVVDLANGELVAVADAIRRVERAEITTAQQKSYRWTFLASGMTHPNFIRTLGELSTAGQARVAEMAKSLS